MTGEATNGAVMGKTTVGETHVLDVDSQLVRQEAGNFAGTFSERPCVTTAPSTCAMASQLVRCPTADSPCHLTIADRPVRPA